MVLSTLYYLSEKAINQFKCYIATRKPNLCKKKIPKLKIIFLAIRPVPALEQIQWSKAKLVFLRKVDNDRDTKRKHRKDLSPKEKCLVFH